MTTARYLWLGFGVLIVFLIVSSLLIVHRVAAIEGEIREMADARNFSSAASQLETDTLRYALNVRAYLQTGDELALREMAAASGAEDQHLQDYLRLGKNDRRYEMAASFEPVWQELRSLGEALVAPENRDFRLEHSRRFFELRMQLQEMLAGQLQAEALSVYNERKDAALRDVRTVARFVLLLLVGGLLLALATGIATARGVIDAEVRVRANRELLRASLASIGDAVITTDAQGRVTYLNPVAESFCGWAQDAAEGQPLESVVHLMEIEQQGQAGDNLATQLLRDAVGRSGHVEGMLISRHGSERAVCNSASPILDERGGVVGVIIICRDDTARRALETDLRQKVSEIAQADRHKTEFLAMLAHELRNPIAPISNALQILRHRIAEAPALQPTVAMMERQIVQVVRLIDDLMDLSRISRGKIELRLEPTDLVPALQLAVEAVVPLLDSLDHDLKVALPAHPIVVMADPARLAQIVGNLLSNAAKFTDRGGQIDLAAECDDQWARIRVRDSGIGISEQHLPYVFDLYMQTDNSLGRSGSGVGLGLALVKSLVELHGGDVVATSAGLGRGSEFAVRVPLYRGSVPESPALIDSPSHAQRSTRVLVVDDNRDAAASLSQVLQLNGHQARCAFDGEEALGIAQAWHPEVIFLDIGLPGLTGFDVARVIRSHPWGEGILLIALTGWGQDDDRRRTAEAGFAAHLVKPAPPERVLALVSKLRGESAPALADA